MAHLGGLMGMKAPTQLLSIIIVFSYLSLYSDSTFSFELPLGLQLA